MAAAVVPVMADPVREGMETATTTDLTGNSHS